VKRALVLSYHFPPIGGAGAQKPAKLVARLLDHGWRSTVVTGPGLGTGRWTPLDDELSGDIPPEVPVHRVPGPEPAPSLGWRGRAERWVGLEPWSGWWIDGAVRAGRDAASGGIDLVYTWLAPYETTVAAARLAHELGVPWVADLGDPWALDEMVVYPTALHRRHALAQMRLRLASAAAIVMSTPEAAARLRAAFPELAHIPVVASGNGFDARDFAPPVAPRADGAFRIVHTGYLHTALGRRHRHAARLRRLAGGTVRGVDFLTRSHVYLLEAVERLVAHDPELGARVAVHLAGVLSADDRDAAGSSPHVKLHGYLSHRETLQLMRTADLLFLPMHELPSGLRATIVPGKTYEYLAARRPILAAVPEGDARDILAEAGNALIVRPSDVEGMRRAIARQLRRARAGHPLATEPRPHVLARYEYGALAAEIAAVFDRVAAPPAVRRTRAVPAPAH
jgi:glycosyltransferase involved in cell wall biosynthesis